jgi:hypothetical protein
MAPTTAAVPTIVARIAHLVLPGASESAGFAADAGIGLAATKREAGPGSVNGNGGRISAATGVLSTPPALVAASFKAVCPAVNWARLLSPGLEASEFCARIGETAKERVRVHDSTKAQSDPIFILHLQQTPEAGIVSVPKFGSRQIAILSLWGLSRPQLKLL